MMTFKVHCSHSSPMTSCPPLLLAHPTRPLLSCHRAFAQTVPSLWNTLSLLVHTFILSAPILLGKRNISPPEIIVTPSFHSLSLFHSSLWYFSQTTEYFLIYHWVPPLECKFHQGRDVHLPYFCISSMLGRAWHILNTQEILLNWLLMVHSCNPSYLGG
jgi:hypothetical protein